MVYARATEGFKAGGFNLSAPAGFESFDAETAWNYELGWRQAFANKRYSLGATAFRIDWKDMQLSQFDATAGGYVANVGKSTSEGLEFEGTAELGKGLDGYGSFGLLKTEIDEFTDPFGTDTSGNDLPFAPDSTWSLGLAYTGKLPSGETWTFGGDYTRTGDFFYDAGNRAGDSFGLANFRVGADAKTYSVSVWVHNALDDDYETVAFQPSPVDPNTFVGESGAPRVLGFTLSFHL
jgi:iron complex outermembrane receptor protein